MNSKRIFPGPAGILDESGNCCKRNKVDSETGGTQGTVTESPLREAPWIEIRKIISMHQSLTTEARSMLPKYRPISWIRKCSTKSATINKIPFLVGVMTTVPKSQALKADKNNSQCITMADESGAIEVALDPSVVYQVEGIIHTGSAMALQNIGVMNLKGRLTLMCSSKNLLAVYSLKCVTGKAPKVGTKCEVRETHDVVIYNFMSD